MPSPQGPERKNDWLGGEADMQKLMHAPANQNTFCDCTPPRGVLENAGAEERPLQTHTSHVHVLAMISHNDADDPYHHSTI